MCCQNTIGTPLIYEVWDKSSHWHINSRKAINPRRHQRITIPFHQLINTQFRKYTSPSTPNPVSSQSHNLAISPTQKLKLLFYILQSRSKFRSVLAKILVKKLLKSKFFYPFTPWGLPVLKPKTCILHHLAFLFGLPTRKFSCSIIPF